MCTELSAVQGQYTVGILIDPLPLAPNKVPLPIIQAAERGVETFDVRPRR